MEGAPSPPPVLTVYFSYLLVLFDLHCSTFGVPNIKNGCLNTVHKTCFILTLEKLATEPHFKEISLLVQKRTCLYNYARTHV